MEPLFESRGIRRADTYLAAVSYTHLDVYKRQILEFAQLKKEGQIQKIIVTGCLAERYQEELVRELPECDGVLGLGANGDIVEAVRAVMRGEPMVRFPDKSCWKLDGARLQTTPSFFAYLRVGDGCNNCCAYCAIPKIRGPLRSREMESLVAEARTLAENGVRELVLVAQDTTPVSYTHLPWAS